MKWNEVKNLVAHIVEDAEGRVPQLIYATRGNLLERLGKVSGAGYPIEAMVINAINYLEKKKDSVKTDLEVAKRCVVESSSLDETIDCIIEKTEIPEVPLGVLNLALPIALRTIQPKIKSDLIIEEVDY